MNESLMWAHSDNEDDGDLPSYNEPGYMLFVYQPANDESEQYEIIDVDGSAFWLVESGFPDYWLKDNIDLELEGFYVLEGIKWHAWRDYFGEYYEEWTFEFCRRASQEEIDSQSSV